MWKRCGNAVPKRSRHTAPLITSMVAYVTTKLTNTFSAWEISHINKFYVERFQIYIVSNFRSFLNRTDFRHQNWKSKPQKLKHFYMNIEKANLQKTSTFSGLCDLFVIFSTKPLWVEILRKAVRTLRVKHASSWNQYKKFLRLKQNKNVAIRI